MAESFVVLSTPSFNRHFKKIFSKQRLIKEVYADALSILSTDPYNLKKGHDIKKLSDIKPGEGLFRLRMGKWRIRYDIFGQKVVLHSFSDRKEAY